MDSFSKIFPLLIPIILLHYTLAAIAIVNLVKRKKVRFNNKYIWGAIIIFVNIFGPVLYFIFRGDDE